MLHPSGHDVYRYSKFGECFWIFTIQQTMRAGLVSDYVVRLLDHMDASGARVVTPRLRAQDADMETRPWIDPENFDAGYIMRSLDKLPRQGDKQPWVMTQNYHVDRYDVPAADLDDGTLVYEAAKVAAE